MAETTSAYPVNLSIDYPDRGLNRLTTDRYPPFRLSA